MNESREIRNMRQMAWERAKGELRSMLCTYWDDGQNYQTLKNEVENFIERVEDNGVCE